MPRETLEIEDNGLFLKNKVAQSSRPHFSSGCTILDLYLGGGWCEGQIVLLCGESQVGKSHFVIEAAANFLKKYKDNPKAKCRLKDTENALDKNYIERIGVDTKRIETPSILELPNTIQAVMRDIDIYFRGKKEKGKKRTRLKNRPPLLYSVDSWDGLTVESDDDRGIDEEAGYEQARKAAKGSDFGRKLSGICEEQGFTLFVCFQLRDNISPYGAKQRISGGNWSKYYSTQRVWLKTTSKDKIIGKRKGFERAFGHWVSVQVQKNRRSGESPEFRIPLIYNYGIDDLAACVRFLIDERAADRMFEHGKKDANTQAEKYLKSVWTLPESDYKNDLKEARKQARKLFNEIKEAFAPKRSKYG